ncbi:MAG TPA: hypothetical protein VGD80_00685 [Kofleriaceae bacterium]
MSRGSAGGVSHGSGAKRLPGHAVDRAVQRLPLRFDQDTSLIEQTPVCDVP